MEGFRETLKKEEKQNDLKEQETLKERETLLPGLKETNILNSGAGSGLSHLSEVKEIIAARLDSPELSLKEGTVINPSYGGVLEESKAESARMIIKESLDSQRFVPDEGVIIKHPGESIEGDTQKEKKEAVREAFRKYVEMIAAGHIWELLNKEDEEPEKGSVYYTEMRDAVKHVMTLTEKLIIDREKGTEEVSENDLVEAMTRLSETAHIYYDTHRGMRNTQKGKNRKEASTLIRNLTDHFFDDMDIKLNNEGLIPAVKREGYTEKEGKQARSRLSELVKQYGKWKKHFAYNEADERANVKAKADLFAVYERDMDIYRSLYRKNPEKMVPDIAYIIKEARYYKVQNRVLKSFEKSGIVERDPVYDLATKHVDRMDYKKPEEELSPEETDRDLSKEQLMAIERIDRWFIRNYNNGGIVGRPLNIKNHHGEIVLALMSRTKRERLFIYYLIETGARKDPKVFDAYASQTEYKPDIDKLKRQMVASKIKLMSRLVGGYVYMHKLSEALQINRDYKELIKDSARITRMEKEGTDGSELKDPLEIRSLMLKKAYISCKNYKEKAEECSRAKEKERAGLEKQVAEAEKQYKKDFEALLAADDAVGEAESKYGQSGEKGEKSGDRLLNREDDNKGEFKSNLDTYAVAGEKGGEFTAAGINAVVGTAGLLSGRRGSNSWHLSDSSIAKVSKYSHGYTASAISGLGHAMAVMYGIYNLYENGAKMHAGDKAREVAEMLSSGADSYISYRTGVELVGKYARSAGEVKKSRAVEVSGSLKTASFVTSGVGLMIDTYNLTAGVLDCNNANNAAYYLDKKLEKAKSLKDAPENETEEQKEERLKKRKEARYDRDMLKLADLMSGHKVKYSGLQAITNISSMLGVTVPGIGVVLSAAGAVGGIVVSILNAVDMGNIQEAMFDRYFHFDEFMEKVKERMAEKGRKIHDEKEYRNRMRRKLAAAAGYGDMTAAADQISKRYADQVCEKLFSGKEVLEEDEKKGYIELVKAFGLPYDEEKKIPDAKLLARRMSGR